MLRDFNAKTNYISSFFDDELVIQDKSNRLETDKKSRPIYFDVNDQASLDLDSIRDTNENLGALISFTQRKLGKFEYGRHSKKFWESNYMIPSKRSFKRYIKANLYYKDIDTDMARDLHINTSQESIESWIKEVIQNARDHRQGSNIVTGDIGSGKSSFIKYALNYYHDFFEEKKVIPSRVEYNKVRGKIPKGYNKQEEQQEILESVILRNAFRDLVLFLNRKGIVSTFGNDTALTVKSQLFMQREDYYKYIYQTCEDIKNLGDELIRIYDYITGDWKFKLESLYQIPLKLIAATIKYAYEVFDYRFIIVFDGFDLINLYDAILQEPENKLFASMENILFARARTFKYLEQAFYSVVCVLREDTHTMIARPINHNRYTEINVNKKCIFPPSSSQLIQHYINSLKLELGDNLTNQDLTLIKRIFLNFSKHHIIKLNGKRRKSEFNIEALFNNNARRYLNFFEKAFTYFVHEAIKELKKLDSKRKKQEITTSTVLKDIYRHLDWILIRHDYKITHIFLMGIRSNFINEFNFVDDSKKIMRNQSRDGFMDNIFDYLIPNERGNYPNNIFLLKYNILSEVHKKGNCSIRYIKSTYVDDSIDEVLIDRIIILLIKNSFLKTLVGAPGELTLEDSIYVTMQPKGTLLINHYCYQLEYLQVVFRAVNFPSCLIEKLDFSSYPGLANNLNEIYQWVSDSFHIAYLFYQYSLYLEKKHGREGLYEYKLSEKIRESVKSKIPILFSRLHDDKKIDTAIKKVESMKKHLSKI